MESMEIKGMTSYKRRTEKYESKWKVWSWSGQTFAPSVWDPWPPLSVARGLKIGKLRMTFLKFYCLFPMSSDFLLLSIHFTVCGWDFHYIQKDVKFQLQESQLKLKSIFVQGFYVSKDVVMHGKYLANINHVMKSPYENILSKIPKT